MNDFRSTTPKQKNYGLVISLMYASPGQVFLSLDLNYRFTILFVCGLQAEISFRIVNLETTKWFWVNKMAQVQAWFIVFVRYREIRTEFSICLDAHANDTI